MIEFRIPSCPGTVTELRAACAAQLLAWQGNIPGRCIPMFEFGNIMYQEARGQEERLITINEYCSLLRESMYGGIDEILMIVQMYKLQVFLYSADSYRGGDPIPEKFLLNSSLSEDAKENAGCTTIHFHILQLVHRTRFSSRILGPRIHLLLEPGKTGFGDHTTLMIHKYHKHTDYLSRLAEVDVDYRVCDTKYGRGLEALRRFDIGEVIERYDGHRVDSSGNVAIRRAAVSSLMLKYPEIDREKNQTPFQKTHAIRLGRFGRTASWGSRESGLLVDGGPLSHPCLDHVKGVGRMALADSGNPRNSNM